MKNYLPTHPLQSVEWGEFRKKTGIKVVNIDGLQMTIHKIPHTPWAIGYVPKGTLPTKDMISELEKIGKHEKCIFIQLEPSAVLDRHSGKGDASTDSRIDSGQARMTGLKTSFHPLFTRYTFVLDLTQSEEELLRKMHPKTRYNIKVALKHSVEIVEDNSDKAFEDYLKLTGETTRRQGFYAHTERYHRLMWETLKVQSAKRKVQSYYGKLTAHLFLANYRPTTNDQRPITLAAWILFVYKDTLYYPYGASSNLHRETMASNLMMWEVIRFGKKLGLKKFDMWGALSSNPDKDDHWYGFHRFKEGYGPKHVEFVGSFDLVINPMLYQIYKILDKIRWTLLKIKR